MRPMTRQEIAAALREYALYHRTGEWWDLPLDQEAAFKAVQRCMNRGEPDSSSIPETVRRMFLLFIAESLA